MPGLEPLMDGAPDAQIGKLVVGPLLGFEVFVVFLPYRVETFEDWMIRRQIVHRSKA